MSEFEREELDIDLDNLGTTISVRTQRTDDQKSVQSLRFERIGWQLQSSKESVFNE